MRRRQQQFGIAAAGTRDLAVAGAERVPVPFAVTLPRDVAEPGTFAVTFSFPFGITLSVA